MRITDKLLITPKDIEPSFSEWKVQGVFNPAAVRLPDGKILLMARVAEAHLHNEKVIHCPMITDSGFTSEAIPMKRVRKRTKTHVYLRNGVCRLTTFSHFRTITLHQDGVHVEHAGRNPAFTGLPGEGEYGVEDPRLTKLQHRYAMTYVGVSRREGISTFLALSDDLISWKRQGIIFREQNKDAVLFPEKIKGKYVALNRPEGTFAKPSIWISYSPDLIYWGREKSLLQPRSGWEESRIGAGTPPLKTPEGWLCIYHGMREQKQQHRIIRSYSAGAFLLDLKNPERVLARSSKDIPLIKPNKPYEQKGFIANVVFPTGAVMGINKKDLLIYAGGADAVISVKKIRLKDIFNHMEWAR